MKTLETLFYHLEIYLFVPLTITRIAMTDYKALSFQNYINSDIIKVIA